MRPSIFMGSRISDDYTVVFFFFLPIPVKMLARKIIKSPQQWKLYPRKFTNENVAGIPATLVATPTMTRVGFPCGIKPFVAQATPSKIFALRHGSASSL